MRSRRDEFGDAGGIRLVREDAPELRVALVFIEQRGQAGIRKGLPRQQTTARMNS